jgi:hypothetical protein
MRLSHFNRLTRSGLLVGPCGLLARAHGRGRFLLRSRGGIGRRVRLRTVWGNPWRFESSREQWLMWTVLNLLLTKE